MVFGLPGLAWRPISPSGEISPACVVKRRFNCQEGREIPRKRTD
jgi:hypothetical protein